MFHTPAHKQPRPPEMVGRCTVYRARAGARPAFNSVEEAIEYEDAYRRGVPHCSNCGAYGHAAHHCEVNSEGNES